MPCFYPVDAWYSSTPNESGRYPIVFSPRGAYVDRPLQVPCGRCVGCRGDQAKMWAVRMYHEASQHEQNSFLTLTYSDPPPCLVKRDLQLFFKRFRRHIGKFRYFACGEYGEKTRRPHYHVVVFGHDFLGGSISINHELYTHPWLQQEWSHGLVSVGSFTLESAMYVAGYCLKKAGDEDTFNCMSRKPGIGYDWLRKYGDDIRRTGFVTIDGVKFSVPHRYLDWDTGDDFAELIERRKAYVQDLSPEKVWQRRVALRAKEFNLKSKLSSHREAI